MENPIFLFYLFHVVLSSIIFPGMIPLFFATFVVFLFGALVYLEYNGIIPHYGIFNTGIHENKLAIYLTLIVFSITVYVAAYICTTFMQLYRDIKRQIDEQNRTLIELDKQKNQFFMTTSHEMKSPIIAIKTSIDGVVKNFVNEMDPRALDLLRRASARSEQMLNILKELLDLSRNRLTVAKKEHDTIDLIKLLNEVIQEDIAHAESREMQIDLNIPDIEVIIKADPGDFKKIFSNLFGNALRYTPDGGKISVKAKMITGNLNLSFKDTGIGIAREDLPKIFNEFHRAENAKKMVAYGTGLGLSLVHQLVQNYGGSLDVASELNKGTTFKIILPIKGKDGDI